MADNTVPRVWTDRPRAELSQADKSHVETSLIHGALSRASTLSFVYALTFSVYSFTSFDFIHAFDHRVTLFQNTWPRLLFNAGPLVALGLYALRKGRTAFTLSVWCASLPLLFMAACLVHVWPIMWHITPEIYLYVHAANVFIIATAYITVAPPPRYVAMLTCLFLLLVATPIFVLLLRAGAYQIASLAAGDFAITFVVSISVARVVHRLRWKVAVLDLQVKRSTTPFLGKRLTDAIYRNELDSLSKQAAYAVVLTVDIRGYTDFYRSTQAGGAKQFMQAYHEIVSRSVGENGGFWHKSIGDGALASFGAMDSLSDVTRPSGHGRPDGGTSSETVESLDAQESFAKATQAALSIQQRFASLRVTHGIDRGLNLGMALAFGELEVRLQGHDAHKLELDIDGEVILRCSRLEAHTKILQRELGIAKSMLIISPELISIDKSSAFRRFDTTSAATQVRNYPDIAEIGFMIFDDPCDHTAAMAAGLPSPRDNKQRQ